MNFKINDFIIYRGHTFQGGACTYYSPVYPDQATPLKGYLTIGKAYQIQDILEKPVEIRSSMLECYDKITIEGDNGQHLNIFSFFFEKIPNSSAFIRSEK